MKERSPPLVSDVQWRADQNFINSSPVISYEYFTFQKWHFRKMCPSLLWFVKPRKRSLSRLFTAYNRWLTPWSRFVLEKLVVLQSLKKFPAFVGTRRFITTFTTTRHFSLSLARLIKSTPSFRTHFNITILSKPTSSRWPLSHKSPHQNPVWTSLSSPTRTA